ncbi:hypothetical protein MMC26_002535 [Xylographa opegraphella]|nr:hypothetical protein [Xylographa opegraphella]
MVGGLLNVVIVGGSLAGLMHGIVLKRLGHNVHILNREQSTQLQTQGAGIGTTDSVKDFCDAYDLLDGEFWVTSPHIQFLTPEATVKSTWNIEMPMTTWNALYFRLRANFDGLESPYSPHSQTCLLEGDGKAQYDDGKTVTGVQYDGEKVSVEYVDGDGHSDTLHADLVIAADGPGSTIRRVLEPSVERQYVGYVTFRGTVPESEISAEAREVFGTKLTFYQMDRTHILLYNIPGENGNVSPDHRAYNYAWYANYPADSPALARVMTDRSGHRHRSTVPIGELDPAVWAEQLSLAARVLPGPFRELVQKTERPFVQAISELTSPRALYFDGKLLLVGDALATFRPHGAASTAQAAHSALLLARVMKGELSLPQWETRVLRFARVRGRLSAVLGNRYQATLGTLAVSVVQLGWVWALQTLFSLVWG